MKQNIDKQNKQIKSRVNEQSDWLSQVKNVSDGEAERLNGGGWFRFSARYREGSNE